MLPAAPPHQIIRPTLVISVALGVSTALWPQSSFSQTFHKDKKVTQPVEVLSPAVTVAQQAQVIENINPGIWLDPRFGVQFTTGPGSGYESSFGTFYGWIPLAQDGFSDLFYTEAQARVDTHSGRWGGNWSVGYRNFASAVILGGYASYDVQDAGVFTAHQLGLGVEALHPSWEARLNGYLPVGDRSTTVADTATTVSQSFTNARFSGDQLLVTPQSTIRRDVTSDNALAGLDLEGGITLTRWTGGQLQGFVGSYLYGGPNTKTFVGFRSRLLAQMNNFNAGLALESDRVFGTNLTFSVGASWGGGTRSATEDALVALLSKPTQRQKNIAIARQTESTFTTTTEAETVALNPDNNNEPWTFVYVDLDAAVDGDGSEESPANTVLSGIDEAKADLNNIKDIVYVEGTTAQTDAISIDSGIQVLSSGPTQTIAITTSNNTSGTVTLPRSGTSNYPDLQNTVNFTGSGTLSGFQITGTNITSSTVSGIIDINQNQLESAGIALNNTTGTVTISDNEINNSTAHSIYFSDSSGTLDITISSNTITNSSDDAIRGEIAGSGVVNATISNNQIDTTNAITAEGIDIEVRGNGQASVSIFSNTIDKSKNSGIELEAQSEFSVLNSIITGNTITNTEGDGILFLHYSNQDMTLNISNNTITNSGLPDTLAEGNGVSNTTASGISLDLGEGAFGIGIITFKDGNLELLISGNQVSDSQDAKIGIAANPVFLNAILNLVAAGSSRINATVESNIMTGTGIGLNAPYNTGSFGALVGDSGTICLNLENNTAADVGSTTTSGYQFVQNGGSSTLTLGTNSGNSGSFVTTEGTVGSGTC